MPGLGQMGLWAFVLFPRRQVRSSQLCFCATVLLSNGALGDLHNRVNGNLRYWVIAQSGRNGITSDRYFNPTKNY